MTALHERQKRIVRVRSLQQRIAQLELTRAQATAGHIRSLGERIRALKAENRVDMGDSSGMALASFWSTSLRLQGANTATQEALRNAARDVENSKSKLVEARIREKGAALLLEKTQRDGEYVAERRRDAAHRRTSPAGDEQ